MGMKARAKGTARPGQRITPRVSSYVASICSYAHDVLDHCEHEGKFGDETHRREINRLRRIVDQLHKASGRGPYGHIWWRIGSVQGEPNRRVPRFPTNFSSCLGSGN